MECLRDMHASYLDSLSGARDDEAPQLEEEDLSDYDGPQCLAGEHCMGCGLPGCPVDETSGRLK